MGSRNWACTLILDTRTCWWIITPQTTFSPPTVIVCDTSTCMIIKAEVPICTCRSEQARLIRGTTFVRSKNAVTKARSLWRYSLLTVITWCTAAKYCDERGMRAALPFLRSWQPKLGFRYSRSRGHMGLSPYGRGGFHRVVIISAASNLFAALDKCSLKRTKKKCHYEKIDSNPLRGLCSCRMQT